MVSLSHLFCPLFRPWHSFSNTSGSSHFLSKHFSSLLLMSLLLSIFSTPAAHICFFLGKFASCFYSNHMFYFSGYDACPGRLYPLTQQTLLHLKTSYSFINSSRRTEKEQEIPTDVRPSGLLLYCYWISYSICFLFGLHRVFIEIHY